MLTLLSLVHVCLDSHDNLLYSYREYEDVFNDQAAIVLQVLTSEFV